MKNKKYTHTLVHLLMLQNTSIDRVHYIIGYCERFQMVVLCFSLTLGIKQIDYSLV